ncbi:polysaccharide deacetylase family protein [Novosphingobium sp. KCTC 2891]|uniref:polysaccharide deacetylase family protein n=1 Tax=Novosphingobium sp. KCTC 2891 TaxID=2989730 RepID=UPI002221944D|nr:polysaccharide deacetylase family protein [Novosphingobium sp. KCTC 2891]MCW1382705.1 polysaccharide deacetylase family protein [Novosphingobium sp. KCTC 2891]
MITRAINMAKWQVAKRMGARLPIVLMYHRVADLAEDTWNLAVSPKNFAAQIAALTKVRKVVPISELLTAESDQPLAAITFDDGYRDVVTHGLPVLAQHDCPATIYLCTGMIGGAREYWWDELVRILLETTLSHDFELDVLRSGRKWRIGPDTPRADRMRILNELSGVLRYLPVQARSDAIARMAELCNIDLAMRPSHAILNRDEVRALDGTHLSVGAHSQMHVSLPHCDLATQVREIGQSREECADLTGRLPSSFAYPFGDYDARVVDHVRKAGFETAVTVDRRILRPETDPLKLPRIEVRDWGAAEFLRRLP